MSYAAHIRESDGTEQSVSSHCRNTASLAEKYLHSVGLGSVGKLVGLLHDAGKLTKEFDDYINHRSNASKGSIDHSYAGAKYLASFGVGDRIKETAAIGMAHTILSHHGLHDWVDKNYNDYFSERISKSDGYDEVKKNISEILDGIDMQKLFDKSVEEWYAAAKRAKVRNKNEQTFYIGMLERLIQSALINADRTDTSDFMSDRKTVPKDTAPLWIQMDKKLDEKLAAFTEKKDAISLQRQSISDRCAAFADHEVGVCRLIVPTGGGKTLSSLRFAVKQCKKYGKERIFYIAPFMSILEQNSDVISEICDKNNFLEHHSNVVAEIDDETELKEYQLYCECWDSPVIATTMVQFLNSLFSAKSSCVRRMHALCNSVIIIDEVQSVPIRCTNLFSLAINFLSAVCGSTVVLCSATQPTLDKTERALFFDDKSDMIEDYKKDFELFHRTEIIPVLRKYGYDIDEAAEFCENRFNENSDLLLIVNTKKQALEIYNRLKERLGNKAYVIHLSTNMCPVHRKKRIGTLKRLLKRDLPVICVTTQLIEAGVDISFSCVVRTLAGLDNMAQAAGRCNRSGEKGRVCPVYIINIRDENLGSLDEIKNAKLISENIIRNSIKADMLSVEIQSKYFQKLFEFYSGRLDYPADGTTLFELLSLNSERQKVHKRTDPALSQAFSTAGKLFRVIDSNTKSVIVPYNSEAVRLIEKLNGDIPPVEKVRLLQKAQKYTVDVYAGTEHSLDECGAMYTGPHGITSLDKRFYSREYGVTTDGAEREILII